jgi:hypothetical protein
MKTDEQVLAEIIEHFQIEDELNGEPLEIAFYAGIKIDSTGLGISVEGAVCRALEHIRILLNEQIDKERAWVLGLRKD